MAVTQGSPDDDRPAKISPSSGDRGADERFVSGYDGPRESKLTRELGTASILVAYLNQGVPHVPWLEPEEPTGPEGGVDAVARAASGCGPVLRIQVTTPERVAQRLTHDGLLTYEREASASHWVDGLVAAIERKKHNSKAGVVLAIDASQPASFAHPSVVELFREKHGKWASTFGYDEIYVVGPDASLVSSLRQ